MAGSSSAFSAWTQRQMRLFRDRGACWRGGHSSGPSPSPSVAMRPSAAPELTAAQAVETDLADGWSSSSTMACGASAGFDPALGRERP